MAQRKAKKLPIIKTGTETLTLAETVRDLLTCSDQLTPAGLADILQGAGKLLARAQRMAEHGGEVQLTPWQRFSQERAREGLDFAEIGKRWKKAAENPKNS